MNGDLKKDNKILMTISYPDVRLKKELETLHDNGFPMQLIIWQRGWPLEISDKVKVKGLNLNAPTGEYRSIIYFPIWWTYLISWLIMMDWDVLHAVNLDTYVFGTIIAKIKGKKVVYDIFDFYGDMMPGRFGKMVSALDRFLIKYADTVIIADESRMEQIGNKVNENVVTINNVPNEDFFKIKCSKNYKNKFKIFIGGKIVKERCIDSIISAMEGKDDMELIIRGYCGDEDYKSILLEQAREMNNVDVYLEGVPYQEIAQQTLGADLTIALYDPEIPNNRYASPNKLFEAMAAGIPIIVNEDTSMAHIVTEENCGMVIPYKDQDSLVECINQLKNKKDLHHNLGHNGIQAYKKKYNWNLMEKRLLNIYSRYPAK